MDEIISKLSSEEILGLAGMLVGVVAILGGVCIAIVIVVSAHRRRLQCDEMEATLKLEMVQRGMSAGDIKQVLESHMSGGQSNLFQNLMNRANSPCGPKFGHKAERA